jgi:hypothetical protein
MDYISETKKLALKWVYKLEWGLNFDTVVCREIWEKILTEDNKNPLYWSEAECEEFIYSLICQLPRLPEEKKIPGPYYLPVNKKKALTPLEGKDFPTL